MSVYGNVNRREFMKGLGYLAGGAILAGTLDSCRSGGTSTPVPLVDSPSLCSVPDIEVSREVTPESYNKSWMEMLNHSDNVNTTDFLLLPGDYRGWGPVQLMHQTENALNRPRTIRYHNPGVDDTLHPVKRYPPTDSNSAWVDSLKFDGPGASDWLVHGLTISRPSANTSVNQGAQDVCIDFCLIEYGRIYGVRIRYATNCTIQRCVIRESINGKENQGPGDASGIQVGNIDADVLGIRILDNEIYNVGDGIQFTHHEANPFRRIEGLIEGNDIYLESSRYIPGTQTTWDENGIDLKAGSDRPESIIIRRNRMWGFRRNAEPRALGEIIDVHKYCQNVVVENNIMGDAPRGMKDLNWPPGVPVDKPRYIEFRRNQFYDIRAYDPRDAGAITKPITAGISFVDNYFARSDYLADVSNSEYQGDPVYRDNTLVEVGAIQDGATAHQLPYDPLLNDVAEAPNGFRTYQRRRWTGPGYATGAIPLSA